MPETRRPSTRRPVLLVACVVLAAVVAALVVVALAGHHRQAGHTEHGAASPPVVLAPMPGASTADGQPPTSRRSSASGHPTSPDDRNAAAAVAAQDPQDRRGSHAAQRAARALARHRALQHVPYRHGRLTVRLTGALGDGRAVLTVAAPTLREARSGYRRFLARYHDTGRAYRARFLAEKGHRHG